MKTVERWRDQQEGKSKLTAWGQGGIHLSESYGPWNLGEPWELGHWVLWKERRGDWRQRSSLEVLVRGTQTFASPNSDSMFCRREEVYFLYFFFFIIIWGGAYCTACGILVPWPGIEPMLPGVEAQSPNHWATREDPGGLSSRNTKPERLCDIRYIGRQSGVKVCTLSESLCLPPPQPSFRITDRRWKDSFLQKLTHTRKKTYTYWHLEALGEKAHCRPDLPGINPIRVHRTSSQLFRASSLSGSQGFQLRKASDMKESKIIKQENKSIYEESRNKEWVADTESKLYLVSLEPKEKTP